MTVSFTVADTRDFTATLADGSVNLIVTSPPFLALRSYLPADHADKGREIGSEANPAAFLDVLLDLTAGWRRVLADDGSLCVELGDTYSGSGGDNHLYDTSTRYSDEWNVGNTAGKALPGQKRKPQGWPLAKSLACVPDLYKIALAYGVNPLTGQPSPAGRWRVRNDITWLRPNPPVGALGDKLRPASSRIIVACTSAKRWFDLDAVRRPLGEVRTVRVGKASASKGVSGGDLGNPDKPRASHNAHGAPPLDWHNDTDLGNGALILTTQPYKGAHYATWPSKLARKLIECCCARWVCRTCGTALESNRDSYNTTQMSGMRPADHVEMGDTQDEVLFEDVREQEHRQDAQEHTRLRGQHEGLHPPIPAGTSDGEQARLRDGTPSSGGPADRAQSRIVGGRSSSQWGEGRQPAGELGSD